MNLLEPIRRQALQRPGSDALVSAGRVMSYRGMMAAVQSMAAALQAQGVGPRDRVGVEMRSGASYVIVTLALAHLGAVSVALITGSQGAGVNAQLAQACALAFLVHDGEEGEAPGYPGVKALPLHSLQHPPGLPAAVQARVGPQDPFRIAMSSGSTGLPKPIVFSHGASLLKNQLLRALFPTTPGDRLMIRMGIGQSFGMNYCLRALACGATAILASGGDASHANELLRTHRATQLVTTPALAIHLLADARREGSPHAEPAPDLRFMAVGGAAMSRALVHGVKRHICPDLYVNYGSSETGLIAVADPALQEAEPACAGRLVPWAEVEAVDAAGAPLPVGQKGTLRVRTPLMALGYAGRPEAMQGAFRDGWFHSTDVGSVSEDGRVYLAGRADDVLNLLGNKVDPERLEAVLNDNESILESVAVALDGPQGRPMLVAAVVATGELDIAALKQHCGNKLGRRYMPELVVRLASLPRSESGKIRRNLIRRQLQAQVAPQVAH